MWTVGTMLAYFWYKNEKNISQILFFVVRAMYKQVGEKYVSWAREAYFEH